MMTSISIATYVVVGFLCYRLGYIRSRRESAERYLRKLDDLSRKVDESKCKYERNYNLIKEMTK